MDRGEFYYCLERNAFEHRKIRQNTVDVVVWGHLGMSWHRSYYYFCTTVLQYFEATSVAVYVHIGGRPSGKTGFPSAPMTSAGRPWKRISALRFVEFNFIYRTETQF
jgi:hypothetical protein